VTVYRTYEQPALVRALAHPLRAKMLYALQEGEASPKELAAHFGVPLANVAYHIQVLRKLKLIRLARKTRRRGVVEHHYVVDHSFTVAHEAWAHMPDLIRERATAEWLEDVGSYVSKAAANGGFNRTNAHMTRTRVTLDKEGWDFVAEQLLALLATVDEAERESAKRLRRANHQGEIQAGVVMLQFESKPVVPEPSAARRERQPAAGERVKQ
jgi:DNA-binding transcriptional ArsR family regulator